MNRFWILDFGFCIKRADAHPRRQRRARVLIENPKSKIQNCPSSGFTLLEVILALVILGAGLAMLGEVIQLASRHAVQARAESIAQSLASSIMDQLLAGAIESESASRQDLEVDDQTKWVYSITIGTSDIAGIMPVEVIVEQDVEDRFGPVRFRLLRWLPTVAEGPESAGGAGALGLELAAPVELEEGRWSPAAVRLAAREAPREKQNRGLHPDRSRARDRTDRDRRLPARHGHRAVHGQCRGEPHARRVDAAGADAAGSNRRGPGRGAGVGAHRHALQRRCGRHAGRRAGSGRAGAWWR